MWTKNGMYFGLLENYFIAFSIDGLWYSQRNHHSAGKQCHQNAHDVQLCDSYFMGLQVLQTFGFLRLNPNPGLGRQELTAHETKVIMVAGKNWGDGKSDACRLDGGKPCPFLPGWRRPPGFPDAFECSSGSRSYECLFPLLLSAWWGDFNLLSCWTVSPLSVLFSSPDWIAAMWSAQHYVWGPLRNFS